MLAVAHCEWKEYKDANGINVSVGAGALPRVLEGIKDVFQYVNFGY